MLLITGTTDKIQLITSAAADVDVYASYMDHTTATDDVVGGRAATAITTAATTDIVAAPGAGIVRNIKELQIRNKDTVDATDVTVVVDISATKYQLHKVSLGAGEMLEYVEGLGFFKVQAETLNLSTGAATVAQIAAHSADTYYLGMPVSPGGLTRLRAGSWFRWAFGVTKGAAGTVAPTFNIRYGTGGVVGDVSRALMTMAAQSAAADSGYIIVSATFRVVGAAAIIVGRVALVHQLATTGLNVTTTGMQIVQTVGASFNSDVAESIIGLSVNPGTSGAWVVEAVDLDAVNLVY